MYRFFESIAIDSGKPRNLYYHQARIDKTFQHFYPKSESHHLEYLLHQIPLRKETLVKCKFSYNEENYSIHQLIYNIKLFDSFYLITDNAIEYTYKFTDRSAFNILESTFSRNQQIIIIKNNLITDTAFSNLIFYDGFRWLTPAKPLLPGTMRASLLAEMRIFEEEIEKNHLKLFKSFKLINALNSMEQSPGYPINLIQ